ncbi:MAG: Xaa-Pro peptidase family protein [Firmicutes bacterium]|nr:Xaa-Pro peptidase family protein [Bacillota bacterium]
MDQKFEALFDGGVDAYIIFDENTRRYFTGFDSSFGCVVLTADKQYFITDSRYKLAAERACGDKFDVTIVEKAALYDAIARMTAPCRTAGVLEDKISASEYKNIKKQLQKLTLKNACEKLYGHMAIKSADEIRAVTASQRLNESALDATLKQFRVKDTEREFRAEYIYQVYKQGGDGLAFEPVVAFGRNAAKPHHHAEDKKAERGDFLLVDCGCRLAGYCSDMTRVFCFSEPSVKMLELYKTVLGAQQYAIANIGPGMTCHEADSLAREFIISNGCGDEFTHGSGHGVGVNIHEAPSLKRDSPDVLRPNMVVTIEPGIYIEDIGGVRLEDMLVITENGAENITKFRKTYRI